MSVTAMPQAPEGEATEKKSKKKLIMIVVVLLAVAGAAYFFVLKPKPAEAEAKPVAGEVMVLEPIQINLAGGHYLRIGIALQLIEKVAHEPDGSQALDATIEIFSGQQVDEVTTPEQREHLKEKLMKELEHDYHGDVMGVYFTEFVTQ